jgi:hypothetical protein
MIGGAWPRSAVGSCATYCANHLVLSSGIIQCVPHKMRPHAYVDLTYSFFIYNLVLHTHEVSISPVSTEFVIASSTEIAVS